MAWHFKSNVSMLQGFDQTPPITGGLEGKRITFPEVQNCNHLVLYILLGTEYDNS